MVYLAILFGLLICVGIIDINVRFPLNYELYINYLLEKMEGLNPQYMYLKDKVSPILIKVGYNLLYGLSVCQIEMKNMLVPHIKRFRQYLKDNNIIEEITTQIVKTIDKNNNIDSICIISNKTPLELFSGIYDENRHIGLFLCDKNFDTNCVNYIYYEKTPVTKDYKLSNIKFMMIELEHENTKHTIELKNAEHNYYIVNNSLNQNFFKYYLKHILKVPINEDNFEYKLTIIDHNVDFINLQHHQHIVIEEQGYKIYPEKITNNSEDTQNTTSTSSTDITDEPASGSGNESDDFVKLDADN